jgi:hypothetical protein
MTFILSHMKIHLLAQKVVRQLYSEHYNLMSNRSIYFKLHIYHKMNEWQNHNILILWQISACLPTYISKQSTMQCVFYKLTYHVTYVADVIQIFSIIEIWLTAFKWVVPCVTLLLPRETCSLTCHNGYKGKECMDFFLKSPFVPLSFIKTIFFHYS